MLRRTLLVVCCLGLLTAGWGYWCGSPGIPVLMYHHLAPPELVGDGHIVVTEEMFAEQMRWFRENGYESVSLADLRAHMSGGVRLPPGAFVVTFDDGYESVYRYAYPVLRELDMKATVNLIVSLVRDGGDDDAFSPEVPRYLTWEQVKEMRDSGLVDFQSHTYGMHCLEGGRPEALRRQPAEVEADLRLAKELIEARVGGEVFAIAWPYGAYDAKLVAAARGAGYSMGVTIEGGVNRGRGDPWRVRRYNMTMRHTQERLKQNFPRRRRLTAGESGAPGVKIEWGSLLPGGR